MINRKSKNQQKLEREKEEVDFRYLDELHKILEEMKSIIREYKEVSQEEFENKEKLEKLYQLGVINSDGELVERID